MSYVAKDKDILGTAQACDCVLVKTGLTHMQVNKLYVCDNDAAATLQLPDHARIGDTLIVYGGGINGYKKNSWKIAQNKNDQIYIGTMTTTPGISGYVASLDPHDYLALVYAGDNKWVKTVMQGVVEIF